MRNRRIQNGTIGEYKIASELLLRGYNIFNPSVDYGVDLKLGNGKNIQIKSSKNGIFYFSTSSSRNRVLKHGYGQKLEPNKLIGVDVVVLYDTVYEKIYIVPSEKIRGLTEVNIYDDIWNEYENSFDLLDYCDFSKVGNSILGVAGEYRIIAELLSLGYNVAVPVIDNGVDMVLDNKTNVQVKTSKPFLVELEQFSHKKFIFNFTRNRSAEEHKRKIKAQPHNLGNIDYVVLWAVGDGFYIIPASEIRGRLAVGFTADFDKRTQKKWHKWMPYRNNWDVLKGIIPEKVGGKEITCNQCGYQWKSFVENPTRCPKCNSRWRIKRDRKIVDGKVIPLTKEERNAINKLECVKVRWANFRVDKKKEGARQIICQQCGWLWYPMVENPRSCPHCHCRWYIKRERKFINGKIVHLTHKELSKIHSGKRARKKELSVL